ncbi:MAG: adenylosuccinate lyase [Alphaproteobacteria bacterium]
MLKRYSRPQMTAIWSEKNRFATWLKIEQAVATVSAKHGIIPQDAANEIAAAKPPDSARVHELDATLHHDVLAFLTALSETLGNNAKWLHFGMTSYDMVDNANSLLLREAGQLIIQEIDKVSEAILSQARAHQDTLAMARTHGMHAEITTFGLKLLGHRGEFLRARQHLQSATREISQCAISGAVGTFPHLSPEIEADVAKYLDLAIEPLSTQVIPRDRHASFIFALARTTTAIERLAVEIRHLQRSEVGELAEPFANTQKGSSAMPHKRNPVLSENLTGLSRLVRAQVAPALENVVLWHERDISHSSVERAIFPDCCALTDFALARLAQVVARLDVYPERMAQNIAISGGRVHSQSILLELVRAGMEREAAYRLVQRHAMINEGADKSADSGEFLKSLSADAEIQNLLSPQKLKQLTDTEAIRARLHTLFEQRLALQESSTPHHTT